MAQPNLFIPHKEMDPVDQPGYGHDMREIEMWSQTLTSGGTSGAVGFSGIVGSGGAAVTWGGIENTTLATSTFFSFLPLFAGDTGYPASAFLSGTTIVPSIGGGGFYTVGTTTAAYNLISAMSLQAPSFTGPTTTIGVILYLRAAQVLTAASATLNAFKATSRQQNLTSNQTHNFASTDFLSPTIIGTDLTFSGTPAALHSAGGLPYIGSWNVSISWDTADTLTQA